MALLMGSGERGSSLQHPSQAGALDKARNNHERSYLLAERKILDEIKIRCPYGAQYYNV